MLYFPNTREYLSQEFPVDPSAIVTAEGQAMVASTTAGVVGVKPSTGTAGEKFMGVSLSQQMTISSLSRVEGYVVPNTNIVTLQRTPSAGTLSVFDKTAGAVVPASGGTNWSLTGRTLTLPAGTAGHEIDVFMKYAVTLEESRMIQGDIYPGGAAGYVVNQVGVIRNGTVFTTEYDTTVNWNQASPAVKAGANGQFTIGGNGADVPCTIVALPTAANGYLGLALSN